MVRFLAVLVALGSASCSRPSAGAPPPAAKSPPATKMASAGPSPAGAPSVVASPAPPAPAWVGFVRAGDFRRAAEELDRKATHQSLSAEERYARARVASALGDFGNAHALLSGLERELPVLKNEIERDRATAALEAGPFEEALRYFSSQIDAASLLKAARAEERLGALPQARVYLDRQIAVASRDSDLDAKRLAIDGHEARARVEKTSHDVKGASLDLKWLAVEAPASEAARGVDAALAELDPKAKLTVDERLARAKALAEAGRLDDAVTDLDRAAADPAARGRETEVARARGLVYYASRADYSKAAELLDAAAKAGGPDRAHDAFYAARALSRSGDDREAIRRYQSIAKEFSTNPFGEEAAYQAARLTFLVGDWEPAVAAYRAYLSGSKKKRRFDSAARYELALASVAARHPDDAAPIFHDLADHEDDPLDRSALHELEGAALADGGKREQALARLTDVIRERPLSFPALASAARLGALGQSAAFFAPRADDDPRAPPLAVALPEKVALFARIGLVQDAENELSAHESELVARYSPRGYEALCEAYGKIGAGPERYRTGRRIVRGETLEHAPTDATRWAWECVYPTPFDDVVRAAEDANGLPAGLLHAVMRQESAFKSDAVSKANAVGLLQLVPDTAERVAHELGIEHDPNALRVPARNVEIGAHYLKRVLDTFGGQVALGAAAYNAGPRAVSRWLEAGETLPLDVWVARIPYVETREYVSRVVGNLARYAYLRGGEGAVPKITLEIPKGLRARPDDY